MSGRQRPARSLEDDREWSFDDDQQDEWEAKIQALGREVAAKTVRHLVKDGKSVVQPEGADAVPGGKKKG